MAAVCSYEGLVQALASERAALLDHPIYQRVRTVGELRTFMETHVFAVWDFMSLLKSLQQRLTCVTVPWTPPRSRVAARLVNTLVLAEESDEIALDGGAYTTSHFELYLEAMREVGADTHPIDKLLAALASGATVSAALEIAAPPPGARAFVLGTFATIADRHDEAVAAAFLVGREDLVPEMFRRLLPEVARAGEVRSLSTYLARHIEVDEDEHGPLARQLLADLCGGANDETKAAAWERAVTAGRAALTARRALWDAVAG